MARSGRRGMRRRFTPKDWVYTDDGFRPGAFSQNAGVATAFALPLLYSVTAKKISQYAVIGVVPTAASYMGGYANPDAQRQVIYAVDGHVVYNPSVWALGNEFLWGWRLVIAEMTPDDGGMLADTGYSMWQSSGGTNLLSWRNDQKVLAEGRWYRAFGENTSNGSWRADVRWKSKKGRALSDNEALYLWLEGASASVNTARNRCYVRTLMKRPR